MAKWPTDDERKGMKAWLDRPDGYRIFGTDRTAPGRFAKPLPPRTVRMRLRDAWRGMVNGWKWGQP